MYGQPVDFNHVNNTEAIVKLRKPIAVLFLVIFFASPLLTFADGKIFRSTPEGIDLVNQNYQQAFISYQDGIEKLIINVDIEKEASEMAWVIPIPSNPNEIKIDVLSDLPQMFGQEVGKKAVYAFQKNKENIRLALLATQVYPFPFFLLTSMSGARGVGDGTGPYSITLFSHLEKKGMVVEVLSAKTTQALYNYLSDKGIKMEKEALSGLESYLEEENAFIVSWLSSEQPIEGSRGIYITFPIEKIFYPLIATSSYGDEEIPVTIRVLGHIKPEVYSEIKPYLKTEYFVDTERILGGAIGARKISDARQIATALEMHYKKHNQCPGSLEKIDEEIIKIDYTLQRNSDFREAYRVKNEGRDCIFSFIIAKNSEIIFDSETGKMGSREISAPSGVLKDFFGNNESWKGNGEYTKITIKAPSEKFVEDLWMEKGRPLKIALLSLTAKIGNYPLGITIFLALVFSLFSGGIAGLITYRKFKKYALLGLLNIFTIIGLAIAVRREERKRTFLLLFSLFFILLAIFIPEFFIFLLNKLA